MRQRWFWAAVKVVCYVAAGYTAVNVVKWFEGLVS